jgi:hypothetical protein
MSDRVRKVDYFKVMIPNKAGEASKIAAGLASAGVNLLAFSGFPTGTAAQIAARLDTGGFGQAQTRGEEARARPVNKEVLLLVPRR